MDLPFLDHRPEKIGIAKCPSSDCRGKGAATIRSLIGDWRVFRSKFLKDRRFVFAYSWLFSSKTIYRWWPYKPDRFSKKSITLCSFFEEMPDSRYCLSWKKWLVHSQFKGVGKTDSLSKHKNTINYSAKMADGEKRERSGWKNLHECRVLPPLTLYMVNL